VEIEELPADSDTATLTAQQQLQQQLQKQAVLLLLVVALYAPDSSSSGKGGDLDASCQLRQLACFSDSIVQQGLQLASPWSGQECQQQALQLLQQLMGSICPPTRSSSSSSINAVASPGIGRSPAVGSGHSGDPQQQQQQQQQQMCVLVPLLLDGLRDTLLAQHRHRRLQEKGDMGECWAVGLSRQAWPYVYHPSKEWGMPCPSFSTGDGRRQHL
jgi:hypothetical protein